MSWLKNITETRIFNKGFHDYDNDGNAINKNGEIIGKPIKSTVKQKPATLREISLYNYGKDKKGRPLDPWGEPLPF